MPATPPPAVRPFRPSVVGLCLTALAMLTAASAEAQAPRGATGNNTPADKAAPVNKSGNASAGDAVQVLSSVQDVIARAIQRNERSVVSIARIKRRESDTVAAPYDRMRALNGFRFSGREQPGPKDPDFIPNDFATGVVVDAKGLVLTNHHVL